MDPHGVKENRAVAILYLREIFPWAGSGVVFEPHATRAMACGLALLMIGCGLSAPASTPPPTAAPSPPPAPTATVPVAAMPTPTVELRPRATPAPIPEDTLRFVGFIREARELLGERAALQQEFDRLADAGNLKDSAPALRRLVDRAAVLRRRAADLSPAPEGRAVRSLLSEAIEPQVDGFAAAATYAETGNPAAQQRMAERLALASRAWAAAAQALLDLAARYRVSVEVR